MKRSIFCCVMFLTLTSLVAQKRGLKPEDFYQERTVSNVATSPRGDLVAFVVTSINEAENKRHREIWMQRVQGGRAQGEPFRFTDPTAESTGPRWSPDGSLLSFSSKRGQDKNSIWFVRVDPPGGEAFHLEGVDASPIWSPDGQWIAFTRSPASDDEEKPKPRKGWIASNAISNTLDSKRFDGRVVTSTRYKRDGTLTFIPDPAIRQKIQLFVVDADGGEAKQLTSLPFDVRGPVWAADSRAFYFNGDEKQNDELNRELTTDIYHISVNGGQPRKLTDNPGNETSPTVSPDGKWMTYQYNPARGAQSDIMVVPLAADGSFQGSPRNLTANWDRQIGRPAWTADSSSLRLTVGLGGNRHLMQLDRNGGEMRQLTDGDRRLSGFSSDKNERFLAFTGTDPTRPNELFFSAFDGSNVRRVTHFNDDWLAEVDMMPAERLSWQVADGSDIEGWVIKPVGYQAGRKYPLVLKIHGGPHGAYGNTFFRTFQILSASGFFVLYPNPRGSTGYGHDFTYATRGKWGVLDQEDYLGGVDAAVAKYPAIDPNRVGVSGGSYGGYMTNWLTSTTDRFTAAVTSRSITNWESWYGNSDAQGLTEHEFYGPPWEQRELYRKLSPISYVENVTAPTLIIHSENDYRTPIGDGEQWFMALRKLGVPVELVRYPRSSHGLSRGGEPWLLVDRLERLRTWFVHWLIEKPQAGPTSGKE